MEYPIYLFDSDYDCMGTGCLSTPYIMFQLQQASGQDVGVHISSCGGDAFQAPAIYNLFKGYDGMTTAYIDGIAASAAATAAMGCKKVVMSKYALLMIHPSSTFSAGTSTDLASDVEMLKTIDSNIVKIYMDKTGLPQAKVEALVAATTWMDAETALALGFIDEIQDLEPEQIKNASLVMNYVDKAPAKFKQVINQILIQKPAAIAPTTNEMTKEEVEAIVKPTNTLLEKVLNYFKKSATKITTNKGDKFVAGSLVIGAPVYNDADMDTDAEDDDDMDAEDATGKKVKMSVKNGKVTKVDTDESDDDDNDEDEDMDADNKAVLNSVGIKHGKDVANKVVKNAMAKKIAENVAIVNSQNALIAEMRGQLKVANVAIQRTEDEIRTSIKSTFTPQNSQRSNKAQGDPNSTGRFAPKSAIAQNAVKASGGHINEINK